MNVAAIFALYKSCVPLVHADEHVAAVQRRVDEEHRLALRRTEKAGDAHRIMTAAAVPPFSQQGSDDAETRRAYHEAIGRATELAGRGA